jgi:hypothetical protein
VEKSGYCRGVESLGVESDQDSRRKMWFRCSLLVVCLVVLLPACVTCRLFPCDGMDLDSLNHSPYLFLHNLFYTLLLEFSVRGIHRLMFSKLLNIELIIKNAGQPTSAGEFETWCSILATNNRVSNYVLHVTSKVSMVSGNCARQGSATIAFDGTLQYCVRSLYAAPHD